eukprot:COSAG02_NODE_2252_length_9361_cov_26.363097_2_plen_1583_part_00
MLAEYQGEMAPATAALRCEQCQREGVAVCQLHRYHGLQQVAGVERRRLLLLDAGAGTAVKSETLAEAAIHGRLDAVEHLLAAGADPNDKGQFFSDCAPLYWAVYYGRQRRSGEHFGRRDVEIYSRSAGTFLPGTVNSADPETGALTVEYTDSKDGLRRGLRENTAETAHGDGKAVVCSPGATKFKVITANNSACLRRRSIVGMLLDSGANPAWNHPRGGKTPLHVAAEHGDIRALELLLEHPKVDPNAEDQYGTTPLACAARWGHTECKVALLQAGARSGPESAHTSATADDDNVYFDAVLGAQAERERRKAQILGIRAKEKADAEAKRRLEACTLWVHFSSAMAVLDKWRNRPLSELERQVIAAEEAEARVEKEKEQARSALEQEKRAMEEARAMEAQAEREKLEAEAAQRALQIEEDEAQRAMQEAKVQQDIADEATVRELNACNALKEAVLWKQQTAQALGRAREALAADTGKNQTKCEQKVAEKQKIDEAAGREVELARQHYADTQREANLERQKSVDLMKKADQERAEAEEAKLKWEQEQREARDAEVLAKEQGNEAYQAAERAQREQRELEKAQSEKAKEMQRLVVEEERARIEGLRSIHLHDGVQKKHELEEKAEREHEEAEQAAKIAAREEREAQQAEEKAKVAQRDAGEALQYAAREQEEADQAHAAVCKQREVVSKAEVHVQSRIHVLKMQRVRVQYYQELLDKVEDPKSHLDRRSPTRIKQDRKKALSDLTEAKHQEASAQEEYDKAQEDLKKAQQVLWENTKHMSRERREAENAKIEATRKAHEAQLAEQLLDKEIEEAKTAIEKQKREQEEANEARKAAKAAAAIARKSAKKMFTSAGAIYRGHEKDRRLEQEDERRKLRDARKHSQELLKNELVKTHGMDELSYEYIKRMMERWREANRWLDIEVDDLIAAWVYSMGPGGAYPNKCECGYKPPQGKSLTEAAREAFDKIDKDRSGAASCAELAELCRSGDGPQGKALSEQGAKKAMIAMDTDGSGTVEFVEFVDWWKMNAGQCTCKPDGKNFKVFDKLNFAMRVIHSPNESPSDFQWLSYHLANAVKYVPGAQKLDGRQVETLYRGQAANAYGGPYWSVSEKCRPPKDETCDSSCTQCYKCGDTVVWNGYTSTSRSRAAAEDFAGNDGVLFEIVGAREGLGACFATEPPLSAWPDEDEILLPAGATFKVLSHTKKSGERIHVRLEHLGEWLPPPTSTIRNFLHQCASCCGGASRKYAETPAGGNVDIEKSGTSVDNTSVPSRPSETIQIDKNSLVVNDVRQLRALGAEREDFPLKFELVREHKLPEDCYNAIQMQWDEHRQTESIRLTRDDWIAAWLYSASAKPGSPESGIIEKFNESMRRHASLEEFKYLHRGLGNAAKGFPAVLQNQRLYRGEQVFSVDDRQQYQRGHRVRWDDFRATTVELAKAESEAGMNGALFEILERQADGLVNAGFSKALPLPLDLKRDDEFVIAAGATFEVEKVLMPKSNTASSASLHAASVTTIVLKFVGMDADMDESPPASERDAAVVPLDKDSADNNSDDLIPEDADESECENVSEPEANGELELDLDLKLEPQPPG